MEVNNPASTLKNLIYRLRTALKVLDNDAQFILTGTRSYSWNPDIPFKLDTKIFEDECRLAKTTSGKQKKEHLTLAIDAYHGTFLRKHQTLYWAATTAINYESSYNTAIAQLCDILQKEKDFSLMENVVAKALTFDNLNEDFYCYAILALIGQGKYDLALEEYRKAEEMLYECLDLEVSEKLQDLWPLLMEQNHSKKKDIKKVQKDLMEDYTKGAFYCEYGTFKKIYQLEMRRVERMGISVYMSLITIGLIPVKKMSAEKANQATIKAMESLKEMLLSNLRSGDVITRYSKSQFIILLQPVSMKLQKRSWKE